MSTPKIKIYKLYPGYSSQNDNDIQSATNDELLPVQRKNVFPNNAYPLVGVAKKTAQTLIPIVYLDNQSFVLQTQQQVTDNKIPLTYNGTIISIPKLSSNPLNAIVGNDNIDNYVNPYQSLVVQKTQMMPKFTRKNTNGEWVDYTLNTQYFYVKEFDQSLFDEFPNLLFQLYWEKDSSTWIIRFNNATSSSSLPDNIHVYNLFSMILKKEVVENVTFTASSKYLLAKQSTNQNVTSNMDFIPAVGEYVSYHLQPKIEYSIQYSDVLDEEDYENFLSYRSESSDSSSSMTEYTVTLTSQNNNFTIDEQFILQDVNSDFSFDVIIGKDISENNIVRTITLPATYLYLDSNNNPKTTQVDLIYQSIPKLSQLSNCLLFMTQQQFIYNGTDGGQYANTLYLQNVQKANISNYSFVQNISSEYEPKIENTVNMCRGILKDHEYIVIDGNKYLQYQNGSNYNNLHSCAFRSVYQSTDTEYIKKNFIDKGLQNYFPQHDYMLDVLKGLLYFATQPTEIDENDNTYDYLCCTYYYRTSPAYLFISDYQGWVTEHLRNNPDIFYGKKDYEGDDYIDANDNAIKVGLIPRYMEDGYTISYRQGSVTFASKTQDASFTLSAETDTSVATNNGVTKGGIARANFAYYRGLKNVQEQQLTYDKLYSGGGYKYKALQDKKFPESIGKRWVQRENTLQFIGASFVTKTTNSQGQVITYNLPDLQTSQLETLDKYGFTQGIQYFPSGITVGNKLSLKYFITTNNFSYPFVFKVDNMNKYIASDGNQGYKKYLTSMTDDQIRRRHTELLRSQINNNFIRVQKNSFENNSDDVKNFAFQKNYIDFYNLQNELLDQIIVQYSQEDILPVLLIKFPVLTEVIDTESNDYIEILKNNDYTYKDFSFKYLNENNKLVQLDSEVSIDQNDQRIIIAIPNIAEHTQLYLRYTMIGKLYRSYITNNDILNITTSSTSGIINSTLNSYQQQDLDYTSAQSNYSEVSEANYSYNYFVVPSNYKYVSNNTSELIFSISNVNQTTYFKLKVIDVYSIANDYKSVIVYSIKKYE